MTTVTCPDTTCDYYGRIFEFDTEINTALCGGCGNAIPAEGITTVE